MGARMLRTWLAMPVMDLAELEDRYAVVQHFVDNQDDLSRLQEMVGDIGDLERIISRAAAGKIMPREVMQLKGTCAVRADKATLHRQGRGCS